MGYMHIDNLYKNQEILMFKECYALEKIHGTSAHITNKLVNAEQVGFPDGERERWALSYFSGGEKHQRFVELFEGDDALYDYEKLHKGLVGTGCDTVIYGEAYGGKQQGMSSTYGTELRFVAFDVRIGDSWLSVPDAADFCEECGIEFVWFQKVSTDIDILDKVRDAPSIQAKCNGIHTGMPAEGVVLRPLIEMTKNNGSRVMCKHKRDDFRETKTKREVSPERLTILSDAMQIADEWVTSMRLSHVLDKLGNPSIEKTRDVISAMIEDVKREGDTEIEWSPEVGKAISKATALMFKSRLQESLHA